MADPKPLRPSKHDPQGFPPRPMPYQPVPVGYSVLPLDMPQDEAQAAVLIFDTPDQRSVWFFTRDDLRRLAETIIAVVGSGSGLTIADHDDIARLRDASQIIEP